MTRLLSVEDVAGITGLSPYTIRKAIREQELAATKLRGRLRIDPDALAAWIDAGRVQPAGSLADARPFSPRPRQPPRQGGYLAEAKARRNAA